MKTLEFLREKAYYAHSNTSFSPEKRADSFVNEYSEMLDNDLEKIPENLREDYKKRFFEKLTRWLSAKSNCASSMITGPAKFNVRRAEKANNSERKHGEAFFNFREWYFSRIEKEKRREETKAKRAEMNLPDDSEETINGVRVLKNQIDNRLQLFFDGKPSSEMISKLKTNAFKWSPKNKAWQRILTVNAERAAINVLK